MVLHDTVQLVVLISVLVVGYWSVYLSYAASLVVYSLCLMYSSALDCTIIYELRLRSQVVSDRRYARCRGLSWDSSPILDSRLRQLRRSNGRATD